MNLILQRSLIYFVLCTILFVRCNQVEHQKDYYDNGSIRTSAEMKNGVLHGLKITYDQNGTEIKQEYYIEGKKEGKSTFYYPNGEISQIFTYKEGKRVDKDSGEKMEVQYYENGKLVYYEKYKQDGSRVQEMMAGSYVNKDTIRSNEEINLCARLGNISKPIFKSGTMVLTSSLDNLTDGGLPVDTIAVVESNDNLYCYNLRAQKTGINNVFGLLVYILPADSIAPGVRIMERYPVEFSFYVEGD